MIKIEKVMMFYVPYRILEDSEKEQCKYCNNIAIVLTRKHWVDTDDADVKVCSSCFKKLIADWAWKSLGIK